MELKKKKTVNKRKHEDDMKNMSDSQANRKRCAKNKHCIFVCSRCTKIFKHDDSLFEHMNAVHLKIQNVMVMGVLDPLFMSAGDN